jgi:hypothetical protein
MGGSRPSAPVTVMPAPTAPTLYQSYTPLESYEDLAEQMKRIQAETGKIQGQRYSEVGTPAELGARQAGRRTMESAAYLASLPGGDKYLSQSTGRTNQFEPVKDAAKTQLSLAQKEYADALTKLGERPTATMDETPSWAKRTIKA